ncbi:MAG: hypothetical protein LBK13_01675 [Spirochaetales bacterium]|jgi:hypothetical protein|nr:hypothetical protein [Spirochaetales bacterium]
MRTFRCFFALVVLAVFGVFGCTSDAPPKPAEAPAVAAPVPEPPLVQTEDPAVKVTQEEYDKTFAEVEEVIQELNTTIKAKNIRKWESYLTQRFRDSVLSPKNLAELNDSPLLKRNNIRISNLQGFFEFVVVPSRANVRLDDLKFTDANRVQAYMTIVSKDGVEEDILIYQLEKTGDAWKVSSW